MSESTTSASSRCKVSTSDSQGSVQADLSMDTESPTFSAVQVAPSFSYDIPRAMLSGHNDAASAAGVRRCPEPNVQTKVTLGNCLAEADQTSLTRTLLYGDQRSTANDRVLPTLCAIMKNNVDSGAVRSQAVNTICKLLASAVADSGDRQNHAEPRAAPGATRTPFVAASRPDGAGQSAVRCSNSTPSDLSRCGPQVDDAFQSAASNLDAIFRAVQTSLANDNPVQHPSVLPIVIAFGINSDKLLNQATTTECGNQAKTLGNANVNVSPLPRSVDANDNNNNNSGNQRRGVSAACNSLFQRTASAHTVSDDLRASRIELPPLADVKPLSAANASNMLPMNACDTGSSAARPRSEQSSVADGGSGKQRNKITQKEHYETTFEPCQVCGDKASGRHYGVVSCEGCKGFFKRSIRRSMNYECRGTRSCMVNKAFRNRCQHCRLRKCLETGMKSEAVQHERKPLISTTQYTDMNKSQSSMSSAFSASPSSTAFGSTDTINSVLQSSAEKALPAGIGNLTEKMQSQSTATPIESTSASLADLHQDECLASESDKQGDAGRYDTDDACAQRASKRMRFCTEPAPCLSNSHREPTCSVSSANDKWPRPGATQSHCSSPTCTPAAARSGRAASAPIHGMSTYESASESNATIDDQVAVRKLIKDIYACNLRWFESVPILPERAEARRTFSSDESLFDSFLLTCFQLLDEFKLKQLCQKLFIAMRTIQTDSLAQNSDEQPNSPGMHEQLELAEFFQVVAYLASEFAQAHFEENEVTYLKLLAICNPGTNAMGVCDSVQGVARAGAQLTQFVQLFTHISTQFHLYLEQKRCQAKDSEAERLSTLQKLNATFKILLMLSRLPHKGHVQKLLVTLINSDKDESLVD